MELSVQESLNVFYRHCISSNLAVSTIDNYRRSLVPYMLFLTQEEHIETIDKTTPDSVLKYLEYLRKRNLAGVTIADKYMVLKVFYNFLTEWEYIAENPMKHIRKPKYQKKHARTFSTQEVLEILKSFDKNTFIGYRNYMLMCLLFSTGMRKTEAMKLSVTDIHIHEGFLVVQHGKGDKSREIPLGVSLRRILKRYLRERETVLQERGAFTPRLLITYYGTPLGNGGIDTVFKYLKEHLKGLGIPEKRLSAHTWRHTFAKTFLLNGGDLFTLQKILGHEDVSTTRIYVEYTNKEMKVQNEKYNPLDNHQWQYC